MHIISKQGSTDNVLTYEHICDTSADMAKIDRKYITLGSVCIILAGESGAMEVYMADSNKEWHDILAGASSGGNTPSGLTLHICAQNEVSNGKPNIEFPLETELYLVPSGAESGNLYDEYIWVNDAWELFGGAKVNLTGYATQEWVSQQGYLTNHQDISALALKSEIPTQVSALQNDSGYLTSFTETDPTVPAWAKASQKPTYTAQEVGALPSSTTIPSKTSDLTNDSGYATEAWVNAQGFVKNYTLTVTALTQDNVTVTGQTVTIRANNAQGEVYATAAYNGQPVSFSVPNGFSYYISISDTLNSHFNPTTVSGVVSNTNVAVTLQYSDFSNIRTARDIKAALNAGIDLTALVGEQITCTKNGETITWDVADYDATNGRITLLLHDAFGTTNMVFEPAQALMWCENGLAVGSYTFRWNTTQCYFTLTTAIPAGGQLRATDAQFQTYASQDATVALETGTVSTEEIAGATDLGQTGQGLLNHHDRVNYGSNNQAESAIQWWMNSDAAAGTLRTPVTKFSRAHSYNVPGFMNGLDQDFIDCLDDVDWPCSTNNVYECPKELGGYTNGTRQAYTIKSKFCFASEMEIFGSYGGNPDGSTVFDLYNGADADDRKKYRGTSAQVWWLRSPSWSTAYTERTVVSSGSANSNGASFSYAVLPACRISKDEEDENT